FESCRTEQNGNAGPLLPDVLLLDWWQHSSPLVLLYPMCVAVVPLRRRQVRPADAAGDEVLAIISHHVEKRVVSLKNATIEIPDENSDDVGVDQPPNPS